MIRRQAFVRRRPGVTRIRASGTEDGFMTIRRLVWASPCHRGELDQAGRCRELRPEYEFASGDEAARPHRHVGADEPRLRTERPAILWCDLPHAPMAIREKPTYAIWLYLRSSRPAGVVVAERRRSRAQLDSLRAAIALFSSMRRTRRLSLTAWNMPAAAETPGGGGEGRNNWYGIDGARAALHHARSIRWAQPATKLQLRAYLNGCSGSIGL